MPHVWHEHMATPNVFYGKFSDARMATLVVKHDNFLDGRSQFFRVCFFFLDGNFSCKKSQGQSDAGHPSSTSWDLHSNGLVSS